MQRSRQPRKKGASANHPNLNGKMLLELEGGRESTKVITAAELAIALRRWQKVTSRRDRLEIARHIERARQCMAHEHLH